MSINLIDKTYYLKQLDYRDKILNAETKKEKDRADVYKAKAYFSGFNGEIKIYQNQ